MRLKIRRLVNQEANIDQGRVEKVGKRKVFKEGQLLYSFVNNFLNQIYAYRKNASAFISEDHNKGDQLMFVKQD